MRIEINEIRKQLASVQAALDVLESSPQKRFYIEDFDTRLTESVLYIRTTLRDSGYVRRNNLSQTAGELAINAIEAHIEEATGFTIDYLQKTRDSRKRELVEARQVVMTIRSILVPEVLSKTGGFFGLDHATALHARRTVASLMTTDKFFARKYKILFDFAREMNETAVLEYFNKYYGEVGVN